MAPLLLLSLVAGVPSAAAHEELEEHAHMQGWSHALYAVGLTMGLFFLIILILLLDHWRHSHQPGVPKRTWSQDQPPGENYRSK